MTTLNLSEKCSKHFIYADLILCGETQEKTQLANLPKQSLTIEAIQELAVTILDPVVEHFGEIKLTYGFCSSELLKVIKRKPIPNIAPQLDQHSGYELNSRNNPICKRTGFSCDFYSDHTDSLTIAKWIVRNLTFDRLYFYGSDRSIHISVAPEMHKAITLLIKYTNRRTIPRNISINKFLQL